MDHLMVHLVVHLVIYLVVHIVVHVVVNLENYRRYISVLPKSGMLQILLSVGSGSLWP